MTSRCTGGRYLPPTGVNKNLVRRGSFEFIDKLHFHATSSGETYSPAELIDEAENVGVDVLGISDHHTFRGTMALFRPHSQPASLICGIEFLTKLQGRSVHLLGYFFRIDRLAGCSTGASKHAAYVVDGNIRLDQRNLA